MSTKLSTVTTQYRRFTKNQVLTEGNLNEVVDFFDDQDRLTRICLSGVGVICGFNVAFDDAKNTISVSQGAGVTTDGDLFQLYNTNILGQKSIDLENKIYTHCKIYENTKAAYKPHFYDEAGKQLQLFELLTDEQKKLEKEPYFALQDFPSNTKFKITDAVTLLYLELYEKNSDLCVSLSCDNQGLEVIGNFRMLIVSKAVAAQINSHDSIHSKVDFTSLFHKLPDVKSNRIVIKPENFIHFEKMKETFTNGIFKNNVVDNLKNGYKLLLTELKMPVALNSIQNNLENIYNFSVINTPTDFQYRYDLLNDLVDTYNEIKLYLFSSNSSFCFPDIKAFPKHLMLGEIVKTSPCYQYRHAFYKSAVLSDENLGNCNDCGNKENFAVFAENTKIQPKIIAGNETTEIDICYGKNTDEQRVYNLIKRSVELLINYNTNYDFIKITPSLQHGNLGKKAIPFYSNVGDALIQSWDFDKTVLGKQRDNVSYHDALLNTKNPLQIHFDTNFYRIEGHQGRNFKEALHSIQKIRFENGLGFNVVVLAINATDFEKTKQEFTQYYLEKNHGYEHKAGVAPGGTFIMIYIDEEVPYYYDIARGPSLAGDFEKNTDGEPLTVINPVVADFTLPYMCCDDNNVSLALPTDKLCFDEKTPPFPFQVAPTGGFVKAKVRKGLNGGVTTNLFGAFVFDPNLVSAELIGKLISFTVNNFDTKCQISIYRKPKFDFESKVIDSGTNEITVEFSISVDNLDENKYDWDFGDGTAIFSTAKTSIKHTYKVDFETSEKYTFTATVEVNNKNCTSVVSHPVLLEYTAPKVSIEPTIFCRNDKNQYPFIIVPANANIKLTGEGVTKNAAGKAIFVAASVPAATNQVIVLVNDKPSNLVITLQDAPVARFTFIINRDLIVFNNNSDDAESYVWDIDGEIVEVKDKNSFQRPLSQFNKPAIKVSLTVKSKCGKTVDGPKTISIKKDFPVKNCLAEASLFIDASTKNFKKIKVTAAFKKFSDSVVKFILETENRFTEVQKSLPKYSNGSLNSNVPELFSKAYFDLISKTVELSNPLNANEIKVLQLLITLNTSLFYTILRCQDPNTLKEFQDQISGVLVSFDNLMLKFKDQKFNADTDGSLKKFLANMIDAFSKSDYIVAQITKQLDKLNTFLN